MKFFKLSVLALATTLALSACGDDNDSNISSNNGSGTPGVPTQPPVDNSLSDLEQAKEMIRTAKLFVSDNQAVTEAYEGASAIITDQQDDRLGYALEVPNNLSYYMQENNLSRLTAANIIALANDEEFEVALGNISLVPAAGFLATLNTDGQFALTGTTEVEIEDYEYDYNSQTGQFEEIVTVEDAFDLSFDDYQNALSSNTNTDNFKGSLGFNSIKIGTGKEAVLLSSTTKGATVNGQFSEKVTFNDEFDFDEANAAGVTLEKGVITLAKLKLEANDSVIEARNFAIEVMDISKELADGTLAVRTIPYKIDLTGQMIKEKPATNVTLTLNALANADDIKKFITVDSTGNIVESASNFVGMKILLAIKGDVTKNDKLTIPLDFQAQLERTARNAVELKGLTASVDGKTLFVTGKSTLNNDYDVVSTQFIIKQNNASITLNVDEDSDFITDSNGKLGDIIVNGKDLGDLMDNDGKITAKFTDNSLIVL
ncbi:hypothetical protein ACTXGJ_10775 [Psychrobacter sp. 1Y11]|uniref:hypothetical protein n=1 Tax=Psychrobacter sp. 1Y11 TaxID=3457446 RepID=UPI003FD592AF